MEPFCTWDAWLNRNPPFSSRRHAFHPHDRRLKRMPLKNSPYRAKDIACAGTRSNNSARRRVFSGGVWCHFSVFRSSRAFGRFTVSAKLARNLVDGGRLKRAPRFAVPTARIDSISKFQANFAWWSALPLCLRLWRPLGTR